MSSSRSNTGATRVLGLRCAWCGTILRQPVGYANPDHHLSWTHGMCPPCQKRFEEGIKELDVNPPPQKPE